MKQCDHRVPPDRQDLRTLNPDEFMELNAEHLSEVSGGINPQPLPPRDDLV